mmetsp:Transcript_24345/g.21605  ORF Transcript_24345/g.21605 Transcript_24345/m.21605 type:complete len:184 (+) Transcript_24345:306-857(+)
MIGLLKIFEILYLLSQFFNYKRDLKMSVKPSGEESELNPISREVRSNKNQRYKDQDAVKSILSEVKDKINEDTEDLKTNKSEEEHWNSSEYQFKLINHKSLSQINIEENTLNANPNNLEFSPTPSVHISAKKRQVQLKKFSHEMGSFTERKIIKKEKESQEVVRKKKLRKLVVKSPRQMKNYK